MKLSVPAALAVILAILSGSMAGRADDITTLDGHTYQDVKDISLKRNGLFFVYGTEDAMHGITVPFNNLSQETKDKYHYDPFEIGMAYARQNVVVNMKKDMAFSLSNLEEAKKKAKAEKKMIGFIMEWDSFFVPSDPMGQSSDCAMAQFYDVFNDGMVLVFVRHESELNDVPAAVRQGFFGPEEGGFAPNMAVVTADCSQFVCEIPYGGKESNGMVREKIFRDKIAVIKAFEKANPTAAVN
jgi:hypothetical protein